MVSYETLMCYPFWKVKFAVHTGVSGKSRVMLSVKIIIQLYASQKYQSSLNITTAQLRNKLLDIVECLK